MRKIIGDSCHDKLTEKIKPTLAFDESKNFEEWREQVGQKLTELLGMDKIALNACEPNLEIEEDIMLDGHRRIRFTFESEKDCIVPCYLLLPNTGKEKYPLAIVLQGHTSGFHLSIGVTGKDINDSLFVGGEYPERNFFGLQAVKRGYATLCIEQRGMGERVTSRHGFWEGACQFVATAALMLGRTIIGERVWDVSRAIDVMESFPMVDTSNILLAGHSGGGTATFYTACCEKRIKIAVVAGAFCTYKHSIMSVRHCVCNFIPHAYEHFDMSDLTCLIAPRNLIVCGGEKDEIFPKIGVDIAVSTAEKIFEKAGAKENCKRVVMPCAHEWREELIWNAINEVMEKHKIIQQQELYLTNTRGFFGV